MTQKTKDEVKEWVTWALRMILAAMSVYIAAHVTDTNKSLANVEKMNALNAENIKAISKEFHLTLDVVRYQVNAIQQEVNDLKLRKANR